MGDRASLGFVSETERQVERHLDGHLAQIPETDTRSRAILEQMRDDEITHGQLARDHGGAELPRPVQDIMRATSRVMTATAKWI
jgi:ubiquinone biosynthesis monooxygenase Coq7